MEYFDYVYEEEEEVSLSDERIMDHFHTEIQQPLLPALSNDIKSLLRQPSMFSDYFISIRNKNSSDSELDIAIRPWRGQVELARFALLFNHKYPLEPPVIEYYGPSYDFATNLRLTYEIHITSQRHWTVSESIRSILQYMIQTIQSKTIHSPQLSWSEEEWLWIRWLKELNYFQTNSFFEEFKERRKGEGVGYAKVRDSTGGLSVLEQKQEKESLWKQISHLLVPDEISSSSHCMKYPSWWEEMSIEHSLIDYIRQSSYLHVYEMKDIFHRMGQQKLLARIQTRSMMEEILSCSFYQELSVSCLESHHVFYPIMSTLETHGDFPSLMRRIMMDICDLIHYGHNLQIAWSHEYPQYMKILLQSDNEPYIGGFFEFDIYFPCDYPQSPPKCQYLTTGYGKVRFNPNLYADGKVCLSLLGTWTGEPWNSSYNNLTHLVQAISVMILTDQPVQNEPAYGSMKYYDSDILDFKRMSDETYLVRKYKCQIKWNVIQYALLYYLKHEHSFFSEYVRQRFISDSSLFDKTLQSCDKYIRLSENTKDKGMDCDL